MKPVSKSLFALTLTLVMGALVSAARAEVQYEDSFPRQVSIDSRRIEPDHILNQPMLRMAELPRIDIVVPFASGSDKLSPEGEAAVAKVAAILKGPGFMGPGRKAAHVLVEGNTDSAGKAKRNQELSYRRALRVTTTLVHKYGIPAGMLTPKGFGSSVPVATNSTAGGRAANRRVSFSVVRPACN